MENKQPCWTCENALGGCSWSRAFIPVEGWEAEKTEIRVGERGDGTTYKIKRCPEYKKEVRKNDAL